MKACQPDVEIESNKYLRHKKMNETKNERLRSRRKETMGEDTKRKDKEIERRGDEEKKEQRIKD
jgi:hypothetical protein